MIVVEDASLHYGGIRALHGVNLQVAEGEIVSLIGANGAGKSSLIKAMTALHPLTAGRITIDGKLINSKEELYASYLLVRWGVALVPEGRRIFSDLTVRENLDLGGYTLDSSAELQRQVQGMFVLFPKLKERQKQQAGLLSGGEQQMLALARALMSKPRILLLDEPSLGLAPLIVQEVMRTIGEINRQQGVTVLLVEQNARQALALSRRSYILENGQVQHSGLSEELLRDTSIIASYLGN